MTMDWPCTDEPDDFGTCSECIDGFGDDVELSAAGTCPCCGLEYHNYPLTD